MEITAIPIPIENEGPLPSPNEVLYWELKDKRAYWIDYEIDEGYALLTLAKELIRLNIEEANIANPKPVTLYIHSYGGDLDQSQFLCDLIESSHIPVITVATGVAMSAGLLIFLSGKRRYAFKHSTLLIHQGSASFSGTADEIESAQKAYKRKLDKMKRYIISHTAVNEKLFEKNKSKDWYVSGDELISLGIADKIVEKFSDIKL